MILELTVTNEDLAELATLEARRHEPRTPRRRCAAALRSALITTTTVQSAIDALDGFTDPQTASDAVRLLHQLAASVATATEQERP